MSALALGAATALIVPGTGTPNANIVTDYLQHAADAISRRSTHHAHPQWLQLEGDQLPRVVFSSCHFSQLVQIRTKRM
jgi:hypothetical protein